MKKKDFTKEIHDTDKHKQFCGLFYIEHFKI